MYVGIIRHKVRNFAAWKRVYDGHEARRAAGLGDGRVLRTVDAPNDVVVILEFLDPRRFKKFAASESKMTKFLETHQTACGVPPDAIKQVKAQHARTLQIRKQVCAAAPAPRGPSLSDALGGPILPDAAPNKPGRGTFDTLTGNALAR